MATDNPFPQFKNIRERNNNKTEYLEEYLLSLLFTCSTYFIYELKYMVQNIFILL